MPSIFVTGVASSLLLVAVAIAMTTCGCFFCSYAQENPMIQSRLNPSIYDDSFPKFNNQPIQYLSWRAVAD
jgi:hypothetical protein